MTRWKTETYPKPPPEPPDIEKVVAEFNPILPDLGAITDDPLAALGLVETSETAGGGGGKRHHGRKSKKTVYAVSRAPMHLPRVTLKTNGCGRDNKDAMVNGGGKQDGDGPIFLARGGKVNPLYQLTASSSNSPTPSPRSKKKIERYSSKHQRSSSFNKSGSSGYSGSNEENSLEPGFAADDKLQLVAAEDTGSLVERDPNYVKSIRIAGRGLRSTKSVPSHSSSSGGGTLSTIPEGKVDLSIPQPVWPLDDRIFPNQYDSLVDDALLFYTSLSYVPENKENHLENCLDMSVKDLLVDLLTCINQTLEAKSGSPEEMLNIINEKIKSKLESLKSSTEEDMKKLCVNLSKSRKINSVLRAFSHSSSSGHSTSSCQARTSSSNEEEFYHIASNSSSSGFSDSPKRNGSSKFNSSTSFKESRKDYLLKEATESNFFILDDAKKPSNHLNQLSAVDLLNKTAVFVHEDLNNLSKGVRNALIYGTLCKHQSDKKLRVLNKENSANPDVREFLSESAKNYLKQANNELNKCDTNDIFVVVDPGKEDGKKRLLGADGDSRPSVWEQYYGVKAEGTSGYGVGKPTDVPVYPGGRPEADFTLDLPRSELLSKRLRKDKKWRCRCRLLTSFLGLVFFLLSVMVVSLILTRGKRMFGSMA